MGCRSGPRRNRRRTRIALAMTESISLSWGESYLLPCEYSFCHVVHVDDYYLYDYFPSNVISPPECPSTEVTNRLCHVPMCACVVCAMLATLLFPLSSVLELARSTRTRGRVASRKDANYGIARESMHNPIELLESCWWHVTVIESLRGCERKTCTWEYWWYYFILFSSSNITWF